MLSENEIDDIVHYIMTKMGNEHDNAMIENFHSEIGGNAQEQADSSSTGKMPSILQSEHLSLILELKTEIHRLQNEHRVER